MWETLWLRHWVLKNSWRSLIHAVRLLPGPVLWKYTKLRTWLTFTACQINFKILNPYAYVRVPDKFSGYGANEEFQRVNFQCSHQLIINFLLICRVTLLTLSGFWPENPCLSGTLVCTCKLCIPVSSELPSTRRSWTFPCPVEYLGSTFKVQTILPLLPSITRIRPWLGSQSIAWLNKNKGIGQLRYIKTKEITSGWRMNSYFL